MRTVTNIRIRTRKNKDQNQNQSRMCESVKRRSSSQQLLQNLLRVTAQRSQEDAEEVERERRRRAREKRREEGSPWRPEPPQHNEQEDDEYQDQMKDLVLEEDEGYSDLTQQLETRREEYGSGPPRAEWRPDLEDRNRHLRPAPEPRPLSPVQKSPEKDRRTLPSCPADRTSCLTGETNLLGQVGRREGKRLEITKHKTTEEEQEEKRELSFIQADDIEEELHEVKWSGDDLKCNKTAKTMNSYGPMSPTFKKLLIQFCPDDVNGPDFIDSKCMVSQRHESLRRSALEKNLPPVSKTDNRLQQHTNITQEIKPGDVLHKKNLWESLADTKSPGKEMKESSAGKKYQFVVTGHGKYEKVSDSSSRGQAGQINEDL